MPRSQITASFSRNRNNPRLIFSIQITNILLFIDFQESNLLYLIGNAEVIWSGTEISQYAGAERLLRFYLDRGYLMENSLPLRWSSPEFSPRLKDTGSW